MDDQDEPTYQALYALLILLKARKPSDRSERARAWAVSITELEKVVAYFKLWVVDGADVPAGS